MTGRIEQLVLPAPQLEVKPIEDTVATPVVVRIVSVYPHGDAFRYDLEYDGLEPGNFNLADYLRPAGGAAASTALAPIEIEVLSVLPPGQVLPHELTATETPEVGGYRLWAAAAIAAWIAVFLLLIFAGRKKRLTTEAERVRTVSLAEQIRPMIEDAIDGKLDQTRRAELERLLLGYWRRKLDLQATSPAEAMAELRRHPEAGSLLEKLEEWLHRPPPGADAPRDETDLTALLQPYRELPEEPAAT